MNCVPKWFYHFPFLAAVYEGSSCSTFSSTLDVVSLFFIVVILTGGWLLITGTIPSPV